MQVKDVGSSLRYVNLITKTFVPRERTLEPHGPPPPTFVEIHLLRRRRSNFITRLGSNLAPTPRRRSSNRKTPLPSHSPEIRPRIATIIAFADVARRQMARRSASIASRSERTDPHRSPRRISASKRSNAIGARNRRATRKRRRKGRGR